MDSLLRVCYACMHFIRLLNVIKCFIKNINKETKEQFVIIRKIKTKFILLNPLGFV